MQISAIVCRFLFFMRCDDEAGEKLASWQSFDHVDSEDLLEYPDLQPKYVYNGTRKYGCAK